MNFTSFFNPEQKKIWRTMLVPILLFAASLTEAKTPPLSDRGKALDTNGNGLIDRNEARGPLEANFDQMDCDKNGGLDGAEIPAFFQGTGCPKKPNQAVTNSSPAKELIKPTKIKKNFKTSGGRPPQAVKLDEVRLETTKETYTVIGRVAALQSGPLATRINGAIKTINVNVGDRVKKGDVVAILAKRRLEADSQRIAAQVIRHKAAVKNAEREFKRIENLSKSAAFSRARFEDLEGIISERKAQLAEYAAAFKIIQIDIRNATIKAPYDAVVIKKHVDVGGYVNIGAPVVTLFNDQNVEVEVEIPSFRVVGLAIGTQAKINTGNGKFFVSKVRSIIPNENPRTRTRPIRLKVEFGSNTSSIADNQSVTVQLPLTNGNKLVTVHKDAVIKRANGNIVFVVKGTSATMRNVRLGRGVGNKFQILKGLKPGEKVVVRGNERLGAGGRVRVVP